MNWNRTKSIFIVVFLLLNVFLGWQFVDRVMEGQLQSIEQAPEIVERLNDNNITLPDGNVNTSDARGVVLEGSRTSFTSEEIEQLEDEGHSVEAQGQTPNEIRVELSEPIDIHSALSTSTDEGFAPFLAENVLYSDQYVFSKREDDLLHFNQTYNQVDTFIDNDEALTLELNDDDEVVAYEQQRYSFDENRDERDIIPYMDALRVLLDNHYLSMNNSVEKIEFGYYSLSDQTPRFFSPMWAVTVDRSSADAEEKDMRVYLVNALLLEQHQWYPDESQSDDEIDDELNTDE
ncbi:two-component system regulatory protein YycI [Shouchella sp. 1P09AA]|uniref:two-component system regulatory protein YycI n=1 Tax=unclassified Shouchella TaxID=2893065 RepID=UPI0039A31D33